MQNKAILLIGPHRSGTSITSKIIQEHIGDFPFKVSRHSEPCELVDIHTRFLERNEKEFLDRLYFPDLEPDMDLIQDTIHFFGKYKDVPCVIKEPVLSITMNWLPLYRVLPTIFVSRGEIKMAESLRNHKKLPWELVGNSAAWYYQNFYKAYLDCPKKNKSMILFSSDKEFMREQLSAVISEVVGHWDDEIFENNWDDESIEPYNKKELDDTGIVEDGGEES